MKQRWSPTPQPIWGYKDEHRKYITAGHSSFAIKTRMDIFHIVSKIKEQHILLNENFADNRQGWEEIENKGESALVRKGAYHLKNKTTDTWNYYDRSNVYDKKQAFLISLSFRVIDPGPMGNFGLLWGYNQQADVFNKFVLNVNQGYCASSVFLRKGSRTLFRTARILHEQPTTNEHRLTVLSLDGWFYFFADNAYSPRIAERSGPFVDAGSNAGIYIDPGMNVAVTGFYSKKLITENMNGGNFALLLAGLGNGKDLSYGTSRV